jgi:alkyl sulfatase BDS1-like metallo-beta-lactamase superfamily hydrolase
VTTLDPALAAMVRGRSDDEILALSRMFGGPRMAADMFIAGHATDLAERSFATPTTLGYLITSGSERVEHTITVGHGAVRVDDADLATADVTVLVSFPDLVRVIAGVLDLAEAVDNGQIELRGDRAAAGHVLSVLADA